MPTPGAPRKGVLSTSTSFQSPDLETTCSSVAELILASSLPELAGLYRKASQLSPVGLSPTMRRRLSSCAASQAVAYSKDDATPTWRKASSAACAAEIGIHHHTAGHHLHAYATETAWREDTSAWATALSTQGGCRRDHRAEVGGVVRYWQRKPSTS